MYAPMNLGVRATCKCAWRKHRLQRLLLLHLPALSPSQYSHKVAVFLPPGRQGGVREGGHRGAAFVTGSSVLATVTADRY
jgi:hypothetical protein